MGRRGSEPGGGLGGGHDGAHGEVPGAGRAVRIDDWDALAAYVDDVLTRSARGDTATRFDLDALEVDVPGPRGHSTWTVRGHVQVGASS